jgi:hypothetical protein
VTDLAFHPPPRVLFICGNRNHTTTMHAIARELPGCERWFTPYYCDEGTALDYLRRAHLLEFIALGHDLRRRSLAYLRQHDLAIDLGGARGGYDLVVTCSDLIVPSNVAGIPLVGVQEGMIDPKLFWWKVMELFPWLVLPRWAAGTAGTGLSRAYEAYCLASEGYRRDFIDRSTGALRTWRPIRNAAAAPVAARSRLMKRHASTPARMRNTPATPLPRSGANAATAETRRMRIRARCAAHSDTRSAVA